MGFKHVLSDAQDYTLLPPLTRRTSQASMGPFPDDELDRFQFYAANKTLKLPLVSPVFDKKSLHGLPKLLIQTGTAERLHDESVYAALLASNTFSATNTEKDNGANDNSKDYNEKQESQQPTDVTLEMYVDQPHVFQIILPTRPSTCAIKRLANFVRDATTTANDNEKEKTNKKDQSLLKVKTVSPRGKVTETKQELLKQFKDGSKWANWQNRLARKTLRERLEEVEAAAVQMKDVSPHHDSQHHHHHHHHSPQPSISLSSKASS